MRRFGDATRTTIMHPMQTKCVFCNHPCSFRQVYKGRGLEMVLFPCQQFGNEEHADPAAVAAFAAQKGFVGTVMSIGDVKGPAARSAWRFFYEQTVCVRLATPAHARTCRALPSLYKAATYPLPRAVCLNPLQGKAEPTWNFSGKFLVGRTGAVSVPSANVEADIAALLDQ